MIGTQITWSWACGSYLNPPNYGATRGTLDENRLTPPLVGTQEITENLFETMKHKRNGVVIVVRRMDLECE